MTGIENAPTVFGIVKLVVLVTEQLAFVPAGVPGTTKPSSMALSAIVEPVGRLLPFVSVTDTVTAVKVFVTGLDPGKGVVAVKGLDVMTAVLEANTTVAPIRTSAAPHALSPTQPVACVHAPTPIRGT